MQFPGRWKTIDAKYKWKFSLKNRSESVPQSKRRLPHFSRDARILRSNFFLSGYMLRRTLASFAAWKCGEKCSSFSLTSFFLPKKHLNFFFLLLFPFPSLIAANDWKGKTRGKKSPIWLLYELFNIIFSIWAGFSNVRVWSIYSYIVAESALYAYYTIFLYAYVKHDNFFSH